MKDRWILLEVSSVLGVVLSFYDNVTLVLIFLIAYLLCGCGLILSNGLNRSLLSAFVRWICVSVLMTTKMMSLILTNQYLFFRIGLIITVYILTMIMNMKEIESRKEQFITAVLGIFNYLIVIILAVQFGTRDKPAVPTLFFSQVAHEEMTFDWRWRCLIMLFILLSMAYYWCLFHADRERKVSSIHLQGLAYKSLFLFCDVIMICICWFKSEVPVYLFEYVPHNGSSMYWFYLATVSVFWLIVYLNLIIFVNSIIGIVKKKELKFNWFHVGQQVATFAICGALIVTRLM